MFKIWQVFKMRHIALLGIIGGLGWIVLPSQAGQFELQRAQYINAERALQRGDMATYQRLKSKLTHYPLYPYLEYQYLKQHLDAAHISAVQAFITKYHDIPLANQLRSALVKELAAEKNWLAVIQHYRQSQNAAEHCYYLDAKHSVTEDQVSHEDIRKLWLVSYEQPNSCNSVFKTWLNQGILTNHLVWERLALVMQHSNERLANYLVKQLSSPYQALGKLYLHIHQHPQLLARYKPELMDQPSAFKRDIIANGLTRLAATDPMAAFKLWGTFANKYTFTLQQEQRITEKLIRSFTKMQPEHLKKLFNFLKSQRNSSAFEFLIRYAIRIEDWQLVHDSIEKLPSHTKLEAVWQYWYARSLDQLGNAQESQRIFLQLAKERSFYGFLAAAKLKKPLAISKTKMIIDKTEYQAINKLSTINRVRELMALNRESIAITEWNYLMTQLNDKQKYIAAQIAYDNFWPYFTLRTVAQTKYLDDIELRFPRVFRTFVHRAHQRYKVPPELIYALIRQESLFRPMATSYVGAKGLMQLMPGTAMDMAKKIRLKSFNPKDLYQPAINILLGSGYTRFLLDKFNGNIVLAVAAYNAGLSRVEQWLPQKIQPADVWIESIPFQETRDYVKYVTAYLLIYQYLLGQKSSFYDIYQPIGPLKPS